MPKFHYKLKFILIISLLLSVAFSSYSQTFLTDSEHLDSIRPGLLDAYKGIKLFEAWNFIRDKGINFATTTIGIIDTGVDAPGGPLGRHPEFEGVNFGSSGFNDLQDQAEELGQRFGVNLSAGHGTQVAGIIGANNLSATQDLSTESFQMNGIISGITDKYILESRSTKFFALGPQVMPLVRLISKMPQGSIINISLGVAKCSEVGRSPCISDEDFSATSDYFEEGIDGRPDLLFMIGAGNDSINSQSSTPAKIKRPNTLIVGATELDDRRASFSNFGGVDISAPGVSVYAPSIRGKGNFPLLPPKDYRRNFSGTSASAPLVTGVAAILKALEPEYQKFVSGLVMTAAKIKEILIASADPISTGEFDKSLGKNCFNFNPAIHTGCRLNSHRAIAWQFPPKPVELSLTTTTASQSLILENPNFSSLQINTSSLFNFQSDFKDQLRPSGTVEGIGTHFEIKDSQYLNIILDSSETIKLNLESVPEMIVMTIEPISSTTVTQVTINGLASSTAYFKFEDDYHNHFPFTTNANGSFSYIQDISKPHLVFIQSRQSTKFIRDDATGGDCFLIGVWDIVTKTCFLSKDFDEFTAETIQIDSNGIVLDGNSHTFAPNRGNILIFSNKNAITIKNLIIKDVGFGIFLFNSSSSTIENNAIFNNFSAAIRLVSSNSNKIKNNLAVSGPGLGISSFMKGVNNKYDKNIINGMFMDDNNSIISNNNITINFLLLTNGAIGNSIFNNTFSGAPFNVRLDQGVDNNIVFNNNFLSSGLNPFNFGKGNIFNLSKPIGGNYWIDFDEFREGCFDFNKDEFCDTPFHIVGGGQDNLPWTIQDGWRRKINITLNWTKSDGFQNPDFDSYRIFRSTSTPVTSNSLLVKTITNSSTFTFTDTNLDPNQSFFYKVFVFDKAGFSSGSNEVSTK